jgi:transcriptional regulator with XRE-family HTH domain
MEIGGSLRAARNRLGLELAEVEAATFIRARYLEALETERYELLPPGSYRVVFLREYAEFLGLDSRLLADEYVLRQAPPAPEPQREQPPRFAALLSRLSPLHVALAAAVVVFGVAVWRLGTGGTAKVAAPPSAPAVPVKRAAAGPAAPARSPPRAAVVTHKAAAPRPLTLVASRGSCWLLVRLGSSSGAVVYQHTLEPGQRVRFGLKRSLWIRTGAPWNLDAAIGRRNVTSELPTRTGNLFASRSGIRPAS